MEHLDWNRLLDKYILTHTMFPEEYEALSEQQKYVIQELKKSRKRIEKHKQNNGEKI